MPKCKSSASRAVLDTWWGGKTSAGRFMDSSLKCGPTSSWLKFLGKFLGFSKLHFLFQKRGLKSAFQSYVKLKCQFSSKVLKAALDSVHKVRTQDVAGASLRVQVLTDFPMRIFIFIFSILLRGNLAGY